ncbi:MAG: LysM peptidoglycan-binding domain-containing protein [Desulfuromonadales bacterium]|nr:LysM peptidoglycan-binding domain-containing protein [Desulfuromonadales bacterium]
MTRHARKTALALLLLSLSTPALGQNYFMYTPRAATPGEKTSPKDGVLVSEIQVRKGDTLSGISRRFSGRGSYYPQILLFNDIKNPHLIHVDDLVRVPVSKSVPTAQRKQAETPPSAQQTEGKPTARSVSELSLGDLKTDAATDRTINVGSSRGQKHRATARATRKQAKSEQRQFKQALKSYRRENWTTALQQFDRFLADNPSSRFAADASLYKADCYLKLSSQ